MGDTLYVMEGNAYESSRWVATKWPEDEQAFSFLYYYIEDAPRDGVSNYEDNIPQINGIEAFSEKDYEFLTESVGFHFCDPIKSVYKAIGQPQRITAHYVRGTYSEYRQNVLEADYYFGSVSYIADYRAEYITLTMEGLAGPRGLKIGDPYEKVLESFPQQEGWQDAQQEFFGGYYIYNSDLYSAYLIKSNNGTPSTIDYIANRLYLSFNITDGLVSGIVIGIYDD